MSVLLSCLLENISEILHCVGGEILNINCIHKWQTLLIVFYYYSIYTWDIVLDRYGGDECKNQIITNGL